VESRRTGEPLWHGRKEGAINMRHGIHKEQFFRASGMRASIAKDKQVTSPFCGVHLYA